MIRSLVLALAYCGMIFGILLVAFGIIRFFHGVIDGEISLPGFKANKSRPVSPETMNYLDFGVYYEDFSEFLSVLCEEQDTNLRNIRMETQIEPGIHAQIDPALFARVIQNLLENARKYGREGGFIRVTLRREAESIRLDVEDNGIGIRQEDLSRIWQRFYQANPSRQSGSGLGLGLSMVRQIVQLHGGTAEAESVPDQGSCFTVRLPFSQKETGLQKDN